MKTLFLALGLMMATIMPSFAIARRSELYAFAFQPCSATTQQSKTAIGQIVIASFIGGYLSAANTFSTQTDFAHGMELDEIVAEILKYCRKNPKNQGEMAIIHVLKSIETVYDNE